QLAANLAVLAQPFLPHTARKIGEMLGMGDLAWENAGSSTLLQAGHQLGQAQLLFEKITDDQVNAQLAKLSQAKADTAKPTEVVAEAKAPNDFTEFVKLDIRTGEILAAEKVAKTKKLLRLTVDTGIDQRTVVSGIAEFFAPEEIVGKQVAILVNLEPRTIKGIVSQGMILMAEGADGRLDFVSPHT